MALLCVRNTSIELIHEGSIPITRTGDYSDVKVIDGAGREIPWNDLSRISQDEMKQFMKEVVSRLYTFDQLIQTPDFIKALEPFEASVRQWDDPNLDQYIRSLLDSQKLRERIKAIKTE
jgi:hypothetical protein